jgi:hypothetical protein
LTAPSLSLEIKVIAASSAGLLAKLSPSVSVILTSLVPECVYDVTLVLIVYVPSTPAIVNTSPACGKESNASATNVLPV